MPNVMLRVRFKRGPGSIYRSYIRMKLEEVDEPVSGLTDEGIDGFVSKRGVYPSEPDAVAAALRYIGADVCIVEVADLLSGKRAIHVISEEEYERGQKVLKPGLSARLLGWNNLEGDTILANSA